MTTHVYWSVLEGRVVLNCKNEWGLFTLGSGFQETKCLESPQGGRKVNKIYLIPAIMEGFIAF
jgi:hypothetical protein